MSGTIFQLANWKLFEYTTAGKATQHGSIPGAGGPLYLHPRCLSVDPAGSETLTIIDFNTFHSTAIGDLPTYDINTPFTFGGTRMIGKDLYFIPDALAAKARAARNATSAVAPAPKAGAALRGGA